MKKKYFFIIFSLKKYYPHYLHYYFWERGSYFLLVCERERQRNQLVTTDLERLRGSTLSLTHYNYFFRPVTSDFAVKKEFLNHLKYIGKVEAKLCSLKTPILCSILCPLLSNLLPPLTDSLCKDIDECEDSNPCAGEARCVNSVGGFLCTCQAGYVGDGFECTNVNECDNVLQNNCSAEGGRCTDTVGSFTCACLDGFSGDGVACANIDECADAGLNDCAVGVATCTDSAPGYSCACNAGYRCVRVLVWCFAVVSGDGV